MPVKPQSNSDDGADFLALDAPDTVEALDLSALTLSNAAVDDSARYCHAAASGSASERVSIASLEAAVARDPADTDAWLLLAILQLDFEVTLRCVCDGADCLSLGACQERAKPRATD